jgi:hypothetical protein
MTFYHCLLYFLDLVVCDLLIFVVGLLRIIEVFRKIKFAIQHLFDLFNSYFELVQQKFSLVILKHSYHIYFFSVFVFFEFFAIHRIRYYFLDLEISNNFLHLVIVITRRGAQPNNSKSYFFPF